MKVIKFALNYFPQKGRIILFIIFGVLTNLFSIIQPLIFGRLLDDLIKGITKTTLIHYCYVLAIFVIINLLTGYFKEILNSKLATIGTNQLASYIIEHMKNAKYQDVENYNKSYLTQRIYSDSTSVINYLIQFVSIIFINSLIVIVLIISLLSINIKIALVCFSVCILYMVIYNILKAPFAKRARANKEGQNKYYSIMYEQINYIKFIKVQANNKYFKEKFAITFSDYFKKVISYIKTAYLYMGADSFIALISLIAIYFIAGLEIIAKTLTVGMFTVIANYFSALLSSVRSFFTLGKSYQDTLAAYNRINELLEIPLEKDGEIILNNVNCLSIESLSFSHKNRQIFNNFSFEFTKGNIYCLIGDNGVGKSTLFNLLLGLYEYKGIIKINGYDYKQIKMENVKELILGYVEQDYTLLPTTIYENIMNNKLDEADMKFIDEFLINDLSITNHEGINTLVQKLSGGEIQKVSIIRALMKKPSLLLLDEPTSALDVKSKKILIDKLKSIKNESIIVIITHDKDLIAAANVIIDLNEKECEESIAQI